MAETNNHPPQDAQTPPSLDGNALVALFLRRSGVDRMFGVVGIPVTALATRAVTLGVCFVAFHNEQSADYAAYGYLTGRPGILLTVSGPGCVHGLAGLSNAAPMIMISGSCDQGYFGKGDFQELDQVETVKPFSKLSLRVRDIKDVPRCVFEVIGKAGSGQPGGCYLDLPLDVLHQTVSEAEAEELLVEAEKGVEKEIISRLAKQELEKKCPVSG